MQWEMDSHWFDVLQHLTYILEDRPQHARRCKATKEQLLTFSLINTGLKNKGHSMKLFLHYTGVARSALHVSGNPTYSYTPKAPAYIAHAEGIHLEPRI